MSRITSPTRIGNQDSAVYVLEHIMVTDIDKMVLGDETEFHFISYNEQVATAFIDRMHRAAARDQIDLMIQKWPLESFMLKHA
jgi:hypothetical protein